MSTTDIENLPPGTVIPAPEGKIVPPSIFAPTPTAPQPPLRMTDNIDELANALAEAQAKMKSPARNRQVTVKTRTGGSYKFKYATLDAVIDSARAPLCANGLWFVQTLGANPDGKYRLTTTLLHSSGQWISSETPLLVEEAGSQAFGSALTYMRRYALCAMLGIAADEDDDGNAGDGNEATPAKPAPRTTVKRGSVVAPKMVPVETVAETDEPDWDAWRARIDKGIAYAPELAWLNKFIELNAVPRANYAKANPAADALLDTVIDNRRGMLAQKPGIDL